MANDHNPETGPIEDESSVDDMSITQLLEEALEALIGTISPHKKGVAIRLIIKAHTALQPTPEPINDCDGERQAEAEAERQADAQAELEAEACYGDDFDGGWY